VVGCVQDELLVVKDKIVLEIVDLVKWVADAANDDDDDALHQLLWSRLASTVDSHGLCLLCCYQAHMGHYYWPAYT